MNIKTIDEIKKEVAKKCAEEHFEVIFEAEISIGDYKQARRLWIEVGDRYINQFKPEKKPKKIKKEKKPNVINSDGSRNYYDSRGVRWVIQKIKLPKKRGGDLVFYTADSDLNESVREDLLRNIITKIKDECR